MKHFRKNYQLIEFLEKHEKEIILEGILMPICILNRNKKSIYQNEYAHKFKNKLNKMFNSAHLNLVDFFLRELHSILNINDTQNKTCFLHFDKAQLNKNDSKLFVAKKIKVRIQLVHFNKGAVYVILFFV